MSGRDPAALRFAAINIVRIIGVCAIVAGLLGNEGRLPFPVPGWVAYGIIGAGILGTFVLPALLIRKWRTPR